jgi:hypothetical protein
VNVQEYIQSGAIEACIAGLATSEELAELAVMKAQHAEVREAATAFELALEQQALAGAVAPPAFVKERVMAAVMPAAAPVIPIQPATARVKPLWRSYAAAAGVAILLGSIAFNMMLLSRVKDLQKEVVAMKEAPKPQPGTNNNYGTLAFMKNPAITPVSMYGVNAHRVCRCSLFWDKEERKAYLVVHHLTTPGPDREYQLWALINGKMVNVGHFDIGDRSQPITIENIPEDATGFCVTQEKKGTKTPEPDLDQMYLNGKIT